VRGKANTLSILPNSVLYVQIDLSELCGEMGRNTNTAWFKKMDSIS